MITSSLSLPGSKRSRKEVTEPKNSGPVTAYTVEPLWSSLSSIRICLACSQAKTSAETITPTTTATAKSVATVTADTRTSTRASLRGTFRMTRKLLHSKVPITTINITPIRAASGISSINGEATRINNNKQSAAVMPDNLPRPPEFTLIMLWPIIAQPPIPPKKPVAVFATPWATHSLLPRPRDSVISSTRRSVKRDSIKPIIARMTE